MKPEQEEIITLTPPKEEGPLWDILGDYDEVCVILDDNNEEVERVYYKDGKCIKGYD